MRSKPIAVLLTPIAVAAGPAGAYVFEVALPDFAAEVALAALDEYSGKLAYVRGRPPAAIR